MVMLLRSGGAAVDPAQPPPGLERLSRLIAVAERAPGLEHGAEERPRLRAASLEPVL